MSSQLGRDYFLSEVDKYTTEEDKKAVEKDVTVNESMLKELELLGLIKPKTKNV